ncbi:hypothetical protein BKA70DRAFT_1289877, partial [Coprinopsis sp. MPI-PUGE-AT-0042]
MDTHGFQAGDYIIRSEACRNLLTIDDDGIAIGYPCIMSPSQTWTLSFDGTFWTIQNTVSKRYLGLNANDKAMDNACVREVSHPFPWRLGRYMNQFSALVPYSDFFLNLRDGKVKTPVHLRSYEGSTESRDHLWTLLKPPTSTIKDGQIYSMVNAHSGTAIEVTENKAIKTGIGWAFKKRCYWRLPRIKGVSHEFSWLVLPVDIASDESPFLHQGRAEDGTGISLCPPGDDKKPWKWWRFEKAESSKSQGAITGEPRPEDM